LRFWDQFYKTFFTATYTWIRNRNQWDNIMWDLHLHRSSGCALAEWS